EQIGGDAGKNEQGGDQQAAGDVNADHDGDCDDNHQQVVNESGSDARRPGHQRIETVGEDFLVEQRDDEENGQADGQCGQRQAGAELRGLPEEDFIEGGGMRAVVNVGEDAVDEEDADGGIAGDAVAVGEITDRDGRPDAEDDDGGINQPGLVGEPRRQEHE